MVGVLYHDPIEQSGSHNSPTDDADPTKSISRYSNIVPAAAAVPASEDGRIVGARNQKTVIRIVVNHLAQGAVRQPICSRPVST